jgi:hypothetical protein
VKTIFSVVVLDDGSPLPASALYVRNWKYNAEVGTIYFTCAWTADGRYVSVSSSLVPLETNPSEHQW